MATTVKMHRTASELQVYSQFEVGDTLGAGGFSVVYKARELESGDIVAIKVIDVGKYSSNDCTLKREIDILTKVNHPNIIRLRCVYMTEKSVFMVMDYAPGGELLARIGKQVRFSERDSAYIIRQLLEAIAYLHSHGIVHRDIKLENILLAVRKGLDIKLADFGLSKCFEHDPLETMCGSPQYVSPEVLALSEAKKGSVSPKAYTPAVDVWSSGVVLFMLLSGYSPFDDDEDVKVFRKIRKGQCDTDDPIWQTISAPAKDLVAGMLMVNPKKRLTAQQARDHPWLLFWERREAMAAGRAASASGSSGGSKPPRGSAHEIHAHSAHDGRSTSADRSRHSEGGQQHQGQEAGEGQGPGGCSPRPGPAARASPSSSGSRTKVNRVLGAALGKLKLSTSRKSM